MTNQSPHAKPQGETPGLSSFDLGRYLMLQRQEMERREAVRRVQRAIEVYVSDMDIMTYLGVERIQ